MCSPQELDVELKKKQKLKYIDNYSNMPVLMDQLNVARYF